jgi:hypothetical protein
MSKRLNAVRKVKLLVVSALNLLINGAEADGAVARQQES